MSGKRAKIISRIAKQYSPADLLEGRVASGDIQSLLLSLYGIQASRQSPEHLLHKYNTNRFAAQAGLPLDQMLEFDLLACRALSSRFQSIEISPVSVMGANSALTQISQDMICSSIRGLEVVADPCMALALEAARRRQSLIQSGQPGDPVHIATSHRILRLQPFDAIPGFTSHFRAFALCSAGRNTAATSFAIDAAREHLKFYLTVLRHSRKIGYLAEDIRVQLSDLRIFEAIENTFAISRDALRMRTQDPSIQIFEEYNIPLPKTVSHISELQDALSACEIPALHAIRAMEGYQKYVIDDLGREFPEVTFCFDLARFAGMGYYPDTCFKILASNRQGEQYPLVDGGNCNWSQALLGNRKERLVTSGLGSELYCRLFRA